MEESWGEPFKGVRLDDVSEGDIGLIDIFIESADELFRNNELEEMHFEGIHYMVGQPEFADSKKPHKLLELIENKPNVIRYGLNDLEAEDFLSIKIGQENKDKLMQEFSLISRTYKVGSLTGIVGIIGPTRIQYDKVSALVDFMALALSRAFGSN